PDRDDRVAAALERRDRQLAHARGNAYDRHVDGLVEPEPARGQIGPVDDNRARSGLHRALDRRARVASGADQRGAAGDEAEAVAVEEIGRVGARSARARELERDRMLRDDRARERKPPVEEQLQTAADSDWDLLRVRAQVDRADRERGRGPTGARDASVAGTGRAVVSGGRDD